MERAYNFSLPTTASIFIAFKNYFNYVKCSILKSNIIEVYQCDFWHLALWEKCTNDITAVRLWQEQVCSSNSETRCKGRSALKTVSPTANDIIQPIFMHASVNHSQKKILYCRLCRKISACKKEATVTLCEILQISPPYFRV